MSNYQHYKIVCGCGGFSSTTPSFQTLHEGTQKHKRWVATKSGGVITAIVEAHHRKRLPDIDDCPCGATISLHKSRHIETVLHKYFMIHKSQKPLNPVYCKAHRAGTSNPIDAKQCISCLDWHHTKNLLHGNIICRKCI